VPRHKFEALAGLDAEVRIVGASQDEAQLEADRLVDEDGMTMLPPFGHPDIIAGQGTIGLEILEDLPEVETVVVPLSGGG
jgi:threonine dehydratase